MSGEFMIPVSGDVRQAAGVEAGDQLEVNIEVDTEPREVTVPPDFRASLSREKNASSFFEGLSYSNKRRFVLSIEDAKTPETRQRRIAKAVESLKPVEFEPSHGRFGAAGR